MDSQSDPWKKDSWSEWLAELKKVDDELDESWPVCEGAVFFNK